MGIDAIASLGYGLKISNKTLIEKINEEEEDFKGNNFDFIFHGADDNTTILLCIKQSVTDIGCWDNPKLIKLDKLSIDNNWNEKLLSWAKKYRLNKPKIGWWLCVSVG